MLSRFTALYPIKELQELQENLTLRVYHFNKIAKSEIMARQFIKLEISFFSCRYDRHLVNSVNGAVDCLIITVLLQTDQLCLAFQHVP